MVSVRSQPMTFAEFLEWYPENGRYELINGCIVEMQPTGKHEEIKAFLNGELFLEIRRLKLPYFLPQQALIKAPKSETGYLPDVLIVDKNALKTEPLWEKASTITKGESVGLIIEVVSNNWRDDYGHKLVDYEALGISEYWIVDYLALGGRRYIGSPKQPTITVYQLIEGEYQWQQFRKNERIISPAFPELNLTAEQVFNADK
ncbi:Uma2 family endonuclease [Pleurocapsales cyanobacterium LEGE 06147]|nr:Uma2 family endonuclease [Pleurocapsales cyanobacterium LEGE 06147]